jgi:hypothetical protein
MQVDTYQHDFTMTNLSVKGIVIPWGFSKLWEFTGVLTLAIRPFFR